MMDTEKKAVQLSGREFMYLKNTGFLPEVLQRVVNGFRSIGDDKYHAHVSREIAEEFRATFTDRLAEVGFGPDYEPTSEGKMLEGLIDRFYLG